MMRRKRCSQHTIPNSISLKVLRRIRAIVFSNFFIRVMLHTCSTFYSNQQWLGVRSWVNCRLTTDANATYRQCLYAEQNTHAYTRQALVEARRLHLEVESTIHHLWRDLFNSQAAHVATQHVLGLEKRQLAQMAAELDRTQRKFQLVDSLVDTMLLEEDSDLELPDRSRQVTDLILDLEVNMERKY